MKMIDIKGVILDSSSIALITHINPDGDAVGSSLALMHALKDLGKQVEIFCQDDVPEMFGFLNGITAIEKPKSGAFLVYDLAIALDCSDRGRMGNCSVIMDNAVRSANIDHHISNTYYSDFNIVDEKAAATGELVFELIELLGDSKKKAIAEALYIAIASDTGGFSFSNTTAKSHRIVADLIEWGADVGRLSGLIFKNRSLQWVKLLGETLDTLKTYHGGKVSVLYITQEMLRKAGATEEHTDGIIQFGKDISGVELAVILREIDSHTTKVGFRSESLIDVSSLAGKFDGGGHQRASGCTINLPLHRAQEAIMKAIDQYFKGS